MEDRVADVSSHIRQKLQGQLNLYALSMNPFCDTDVLQLPPIPPPIFLIA